MPPLSASDESRKSCTVGMVTMILTLLSSAWFPLDLSAHQDALILAGNLLAGIGRALKQLRVDSSLISFERAVCAGIVLGPRAVRRHSVGAAFPRGL